MDRKRSDDAVDIFWWFADGVVRVKERMDRSYKSYAERRRKNRSAELETDLSGAAPTTAAPATETTLLDLRLTETAPVASTPELAISRPTRWASGLAAIKRRLGLGEAAEPRAIAPIKCAECGHLNTPPTLYCENCHQSFVNFNKFMILTLLTLAISCFFATDYFRESMDWPWPLYIFFGLVFLLLNSTLLHGTRGLSLSAAAWGSAFLTVGGAIAYLGFKVVQDGALTLVHMAGSFLVDNVWGLAGFCVFVVAAVVWLIAWMSHRYTFPHAYRILFLCLALLALAAKPLLRWMFTNAEIAKSLSFLDEDVALEALDIASLNILRVLAAELVVFSLVRGSSGAGRMFQSRRIRSRATPPGRRMGPMDAFMDAAYPLGVLLVNMLMRMTFQIAASFQELLSTLREFAVNFCRFVWVILRELVIPSLALAFATLLLYKLAIATGGYISDHQYHHLVQVVLAALGILAAQFLFLATQSRIPVFRLLSSSVYLSLWLAPYVLTLFVFVSVSLYVVGKVILRWNENLEYHFHIGPLTIAAFGLMIAAVVFAFVMRHRRGEEEAVANKNAVD